MELDHLRLLESGSGVSQVFSNQMNTFVENIFSGNEISVLAIIGIVVLAGMLIGSERNTRRHEFSLSLPFTRKNLFITKASIGIGAITVIVSVNILLSYLIIWISEYSDALTNFNLVEMFFVPLLAYLAIFAFTLFIGSISGEMISQIVLSLIFLIFPYGFLILASVLMTTHGFAARLNAALWDDWLVNIVLPFHVMELGGPESSVIFQLAVSVIILIVSLLIGTKLYEKGKSEHNGEFLLFSHLKPIFLIGIVGCFAMLGGMIFRVFGDPAGAIIPFYWLGALIIGGLAFLITKRLLQMNVTMQNN